MSLLSLLVALMAERSLTSSVWRFDYYFLRYQKFFNKSFLGNPSEDREPEGKPSTFVSIAFVLLPVLATYFVLNLINNALINLIISTLVLIVCFGCVTTRKSYKNYLQSAFRGEDATTDMHHQQLLTDKNLPQLGFGQALVWLNYRYYIAIMLFFTVFGAAGAVFYRLLTTVIEQQNTKDTGSSIENCPKTNNKGSEQASADDVVVESMHESQSTPDFNSGCKNHHDVLFWLDWLPVRLTSFGYMFVGHFSKALPVWLESLFDSKKPTHQVLIDVALKSEDIMVNEGDCTAEPCLLVRLAKRNALLILAVISILTLSGLLN